MAQALFLINEHTLAWVEAEPGGPVEEPGTVEQAEARRSPVGKTRSRGSKISHPAAACPLVTETHAPTGGDWRLPERFITRLAGRFQLPADGPRLAAAWHGDLLILRADPALMPRINGAAPDPRAAPEPLSPFQKQVLDMVMAGLTTRQMMRRLGRKRRSVLYCVAEVKRVYGAQTRVELVRKVIECGG